MDATEFYRRCRAQETAETAAGVGRDLGGAQGVRDYVRAGITFGAVEVPYGGTIGDGQGQLNQRVAQVEGLVPLAVDELEKRLGALGAAVQVLEARLGPVLSMLETGSAGSNAMSSPSPARPPLVEVLEQIGDGLGHVTARLGNLINRLEV